MTGKQCEECEGTGSQMPEGCETCEGSGWVDDPSDGGTKTCPDCYGLAGEPCEYCDAGLVYDDE